MYLDNCFDSLLRVLISVGRDTESDKNGKDQKEEDFFQSEPPSPFMPADYDSLHTVATNRSVCQWKDSSHTQSSGDLMRSTAILGSEDLVLDRVSLPLRRAGI